MCCLLKMCIISVAIECVMCEQECWSENKNVGKCKDWENMSVLVADLVGRSTIDNKPEIKSNLLTILLRVASGVIGRGSDALKSLIVNGMVLLTQTILNVSKYGTAKQNSGIRQKKKLFPEGGPIDWIMNNPYIKSMMDDAIDEHLPDRLEQLASGIPCVQLLLCRLSPIVRDMQRRVEERWRSQFEDGEDRSAWNVSDWHRVKSNAKYCSEKYNDCAKTVELNSNSR